MKTKRMGRMEEIVSKWLTSRCEPLVLATT
jgi:hypothetical protein